MDEVVLQVLARTAQILNERNRIEESICTLKRMDNFFCCKMYRFIYMYDTRMIMNYMYMYDRIPASRSKTSEN